MRLTGVSGAQHANMLDVSMDLDEAAQPRHTEAADQLAIDAMDLCERVVQPYDDRGFFLNLPEVCLIHLMTYLVVPSLKNLSETSKESCQKLKAIFMPKDQWMNSLTPLSIGKRFILESLERSQKEIEERLQIFDLARIFTNDIMAALEMSRGEIRQGLSYALFEGSLYRFSFHLLSLKKAFEAYNQTAQHQLERCTLKGFFQDYRLDREVIRKAVQKGRVNFTDLFVFNSIVTPPEFSQMRFLTELYCRWRSRVSVIPQVLYSFTQLTELSLSGGFEDISDDIQKLTQLTKLDLMSSKLESLPAEIGELVHLRELSLAGCERLKSLPESIIRLKLETLNLTLSGIVIENLPVSVQQWIRCIPRVHMVVARAEPRGSFHPRDLEGYEFN